MSEQVSGTFDTKRIYELDPLNKLSGREEVIIDNGDNTYKVTVDTLLGYIRDQINSATGGETPSYGGGGTIHVIEEGESVPVEERIPGHFYLEVISSDEIQLSSGLPRIIKVSPNMDLRLVND